MSKYPDVEAKIRRAIEAAASQMGILNFDIKVVDFEEEYGFSEEELEQLEDYPSFEECIAPVEPGKANTFDRENYFPNQKGTPEIIKGSCVAWQNVATVDRDQYAVHEGGSFYMVDMIIREYVPQMFSVFQPPTDEEVIAESRLIMDTFMLWEDFKRTGFSMSVFIKFDVEGMKKAYIEKHGENPV